MLADPSSLTRKFPIIDSVVDVSNVVSIESLIPIGTFDSDNKVGDILIRLADEGDEIVPIWKDKPMSVASGIPVIENREWIISMIGVRDYARVVPRDLYFIGFSRTCSESQSRLNLSSLVFNVIEKDFIVLTFRGKPSSLRIQILML